MGARTCILLLVAAAVLLVAPTAEQPTTNPYNTFSVISSGTGTTINAPLAKEYIKTNGLFTRYYRGMRTLHAPPIQEYTAKLKPPLYDQFLRGLDLIFNLTVQICTATHFYPVQAKVFRNTTQLPRCAKPDASLPPLFEDEPKKAHIDQLQQIITAAHDDRMPLFFGPHHMPSAFHPSPNMEGTQHVHLICNLTFPHCLKPNLIKGPYRDTFYEYRYGYKNNQFEKRFDQGLEKASSSYGPFTITTIKLHTFKPTPSTPAYALVCATKPEHMTVGCAVKISEQADAFQSFRIQDDKIRKISETAKAILFQEKDSNFTTRAAQWEFSQSFLSGMEFLVQMIRNLFSPQDTTQLTNNALKEHIKEVRDMAEDLEKHIHQINVNQATQDSRMWTIEHQVVITFISQTFLRLQTAIKYTTDDFERMLESNSPELKKRILDTYNVFSNPPISPQYSNLKITYHKGRSVYSVRLTPERNITAANMAIFTYIRTGRDCVTAENWSIKVPRTDMKIDFQRGTSERDLLNILDFKPSAHDVAVGEQLSGPMYVDRSCLLPKERHETCIPHYPTSHKYPTEPTLMSIPWICSNIQSDSSVVQDTGLTIISKTNTTLNITTCYANNTFTIPISSGVTAINLVNENQTRCDNGAERYSYILPSPRVHGYTVSPASTTQNVTDWMKISERQRTRYDKAAYKHLFRSNSDF